MDHDFQQWEKYDLLNYIESKQNPNGFINPQHAPDYMKNLITQFEHITNIKSGLKIGKKLSNGDDKWLERWYEIQFADIEIEDPETEIQNVQVRRDLTGVNQKSASVNEVG